MSDKYEMTGESKVNEWGVTVHRIRALADFPRLGIRKGDTGGWIESVELANGDARVSGNAWVSGNAQVYGNAQVSGNARVSGDAWVSGNARVSGNAQVSGDAWVYGDAQVSGNAQVYGNAWVYGNAQVESPDHYLLVGPIGSEGVFATLARTEKGHILNVGCWTGTLDALEAEVERRSASWDGDDAKRSKWKAQYQALIILSEASASTWHAEVAA